MWGEETNALGEKWSKTSKAWPLPDWLEEMFKGIGIYDAAERLLNRPPADLATDPITAGTQLQYEGAITIMKSLREAGLI